MTPTPQDHRQPENPTEVAPGPNGENVVISGMSGLFPMSRSVREFSTILYNKVNPVTSSNSRWTFKHPEVSEYTGKVPDIDRFDSQFFMVHNSLGNAMDPMARKVLEQSYQAIYDAGLSPKHLNGKKVGVFIGSAFSDKENAGIFDISSKTGYGITGISKTMYANRISYWLNAKGPSMTVDDACCGSIVALEEAFKAIDSGTCESAIVGGTTLCCIPELQIHYNRCIKISPDGKTRCFDENADGCAKSDAISVLFLQKRKNALRAYAEVVHVKNEFVSRLRGKTGQDCGFIRNPDHSADFLKQFYDETSISPQEVEYIEACGSATPEADKAELQAIEKVFCGNRIDPLLVGSVISNVGLTDAASGATAITKVLLGYHKGLIASNLHCNTPRQDIAAIREGRMRVVTEHQPFRGTYAAVNCLSVTGVNSHVLLRGCTKPKDLTRYSTSFPRLVMISARQKEYLKDIFKDLILQPIDAEKLALLQNIHSTNISGHLGRGYVVLDTDKQQRTISLSEKIEHFDDSHRPLWFVYSGMGSQWAGMGAQLMRIPIFAAAIERCRKALEPKEIDIVHIITSPDKTIFDNVLNSFVGIAAIQIGLTDLLTALGLHPDKLIGHSVGELGCAYADGCLTAEEMILSAYSRGKASNDTPLIRGAMAAVGLGYKQLIQLCPPQIEIACHNSASSCTISGPEENIREFVSQLTTNGVFAREVPSANIAYHSRYIADAGPQLLRLLSEVIREPRARSERWLSTSVPQERWHEPIAKFCSPEYFTNNLLSSVYFEETSNLIPSNAVLIEIAPHGLLQAILKRSLPDTCTNIPLTQRGHSDNTLFFLEAIGKLYIEGYTPKVQAIYPEVEFPVSTGTPDLAHYVKWNHSESWAVSCSARFTKISASCKFLINIHDDEYCYLKGNVVQGKVLYPFAGALVAVWDTLAMALGFSRKEISVRFHDVHLLSQPILHNQKHFKLEVYLHRGSGRFEVLNGKSKVATGYITTINEANVFDTKQSDENFVVSSDEIYQHLSSRGFFYRDEFRNIHTADESLSVAQILWNNNWVTMIEGLLQLNALRHTYEGISQPTHIRDLTIDVNKQLEIIQQSQGSKMVLTAEVNDIMDCTRCGGVLIQNLKFRNLPISAAGIFKLITPSLLGNDLNNAEILMPSENITQRKNVALQISNLGNLDTLHWEEAPKLSERCLKVKVEYAGINMSDVKRATGLIPFEDDKKYYGMDFSGLSERGERVMGLVKNGAASTVVSARPELLWPVPAHWSLEEAATVPLAYAQAYYYLCIKNELVFGSRVLVHGAAGALGQAAVSVALARGCRVFATVADGAKKRFLLRLFPQLNEDAIGNSRDASFGDMVLSATNGKGCNIIISCVGEDLKNISLKCAAFSGVTIDMVQIQDRDKYEYGMFNMTRQRSYIAADFYSIFDSENLAEHRKLQLLVSEGIALGHVRPLSRVTFAPQEAPRAFRLLAASRHRGRVLLRIRDSPLHAQPRIVCSPDSYHLIVWDGSSFGLELADRLISRGAKKLRIYCLHSTSNNLVKLRLWKKVGVDVEILSMTLNSKNNVSAALNEVNQCGHIEGIYVTATQSTIACKENNDLANIISHLDISSRISCPDLKYFAVIAVDDANIGQQTCLSRFKAGFMATQLILPGFKARNTELDALMEESSWNRSVADITEQALRCKNPVQSAQPKTAEKPSLVKLIPALAQNDDEDTTLEDLGKGYLSLPCIKSFLRDVYNISLDDEDILKLTKKMLKEIERNTPECIFKDVKGLQTFYSYVDNDELRATADVISLNTLVADIELGSEIDVSKTHLFIIPGLEGHHARFRTLCAHLKLPAVVLQPGLDRPDETPRELAIRYSKVLLEKFTLKTNFYLLGYECGIFVALELASILEDNGLTGTVYCVGDGPKEMQALLETEACAFSSEEALREGVERHMLALMARGSAVPVESALVGRVSYSNQYAHALIEAAYARIGTVRRYNAAPRALRSRLVLLRARRVLDSEEECSLQCYSRRALILEDLTSPMAHAAIDLRVPAIVNRLLDDDILKVYDNSNLCEAYVLYNEIQKKM